MLRFLMFTFLAWTFTTTVAAEESPTRLFPHGLGYSYSELTGLGFTYRYLDDRGGWQVSGVASNRDLFVYSTLTKELYSLGAAAGLTMVSFASGDWFYSQLYWLVGGSWRSESYTAYLSTPNPEASSDPYRPEFLYSSEKRWRHVALAGPVLGIEAGFLQHFSFNLEIGYKAGWDFSQGNASTALILTPGISGIFFFRF